MGTRKLEHWQGRTAAANCQIIIASINQLDSRCLRGEKSCGMCSRHHILSKELVLTLV